MESVTTVRLWLKIRPHLSGLVRFFHISLIEAKSERQSSYLGILWGPLSTLIFTLMLSLVFRHAQTISSADFFLYVLAGYILWSFISSTISSSTNAIQKKLDFALHNNLSLPGLFYKLLIDRLFAMGLDLILLILALLLLKPTSLGYVVLLAFPLIVILACVSIATAYLVNLAVILFPDLDAVFGVGIRFMFFASPVFWGAEGDVTGVRSLLVDYNPAAYFLNVFRQAFGIMPLDPFQWAIALAMSLVLCGAGCIAFRRSESFVRNLK